MIHGYQYQLIHTRMLAIAGLLALLVAAGVANSKQGLPPNVQVADSQLVLNGSGMRTKFFVDVYLGALYLKKPTSSATTILADRGSKRLVMAFQRKVERKKLASAWREGFQANSSTKELTDLGDRLERFIALFPDMLDGDEVLLDYVPAEGTSVKLNGKLQGVISGADFHVALMRVFLGDNPPTKELKKGLLGG